MVASPQDWRITASFEADRCRRDFLAARTDPLDSPVEVLQKYWSAYQAASAATGALVEAELEDGLGWPEIADALGFASIGAAQAALALPLEHGQSRLRARLPHSIP